MILKKIHLGVIPLLAALAMMAAPALAQAAPEWQTSGVTLPENKVVYVVTSGNLVLNDGLLGAKIECEAEDTGAIWNEGGVGHDFIGTFENKNCVLNETFSCEVEVGELPYSSVLEEAAGVVRDKITKETGSKLIEVHAVCPEAEVDLIFTGSSLAPVWENGSPSFAHFDGKQAGELTNALTGTTAVVEGDDYVVAANGQKVTVG